MIGVNGETWKEFWKANFKVQQGQDNFKEIIVTKKKNDTLLVWMF